MNVVVAPQGFKGTLTGPRAADAIAEGLRRALPEAVAVLVPMADGGHGTLDALLGATSGQRFTARVADPLGETIDAAWGVTGGERLIAVVEMAQASGLTLVPEGRRTPLLTTTYGTGQLIAAALDASHRHIIVGVGGSATSDGGAGAAQALGARLLDGNGHDIPRGAEGLLAIDAIDLSARHPALAGTVIEVATDVSNPLTGPTGAAYTYGPQKGATQEVLPVLDLALGRLAMAVKRDLGIELRGIDGMGAAGGLAAGLVAFAGARLLWGAEVVANAVGLDAHLAGADLVITGEGRIDWQTVYRKAPIEVAKRASARGIPVIAIGGSLGKGANDVLAHGVTLLEACAEEGAPLPMSEVAAYQALAEAAERAVRRWVGKGVV